MASNPRPINAEFPAKLQCLFRPKRYKVLHGGRGSGKSWGVARALLIQASKRPLRILCTREIQESIKDSVHRLLKDQVQNLGLGAFYDVLQTEIRGKNGSLFLFSGLSDQTAESIKSFEGVDIVWIEEAQSISKRSWQILTPTIRRDGSEIWMTLNPELESDPTYAMFIANPESNAFVVQVNWRDNPWFNDLLNDERKKAKRDLPEDEYNWIWEGRCMPAVQGAIYHKEISAMVEQGRIRDVPFDPMLKTHTVWDLGWNDSMSIILAQRSASEIRICKYIEDDHRTLSSFVIDDLQPLRLNWGTDFIPHDGFTKNYQTGLSAEDNLIRLGRSPSGNPINGGLCIDNISIEQGIRKARDVFPRVYIDKSCERLIECLKHYRRQVSRTTNVAGAPLHDEFSHGADVFRYLGIVADKMTNETWGGELNYQNLGVM